MLSRATQAAVGDIHAMAVQTAPAVAEVTLLEMNVEWFFDHEVPHGTVVGRFASVPVPTEAE